MTEVTDGGYPRSSRRPPPSLRRRRRIDSPERADLFDVHLLAVNHDLKDQFRASAARAPEIPQIRECSVRLGGTAPKP